MLTKSPFLTGFPTLLFGSAKRSAQAVLQAGRLALHGSGVGGLSAALAEEIPAELVAGFERSARVRDYSNTTTFWAFLGQVLSGDGSCADAVARVQEWCREAGLRVPSANTASYAAARGRLPEEMLEGVNARLCAELDRRTPGGHLWRGHVVKAVDGTSAQMPDTAANQEVYPQPSGQAPGCGFPVVQIVGVLNLIHGGWEGIVVGDTSTHEHAAFDALFSYIGEGEILVGDRAYSSYELIGRLRAQGSHFVSRPHPGRKIDFRKGEKIGRDERLVIWVKPAQQPSGSLLARDEWDALPPSMEVRIIRVRGRDREGSRESKYVVSTLLNAAAYPAGEVASLYLHRWDIEVRIRDIKTTMGMEVLRTKSPAMVRKEIQMHMIAYNAVRLLMLKAGVEHGENHRRLSFKGALQVLGNSVESFAGLRGNPVLRARRKEQMLAALAERIVTERPGRSEPRKKKKRPKPYPLLMTQRRDDPGHFRDDEPPIKILDEIIEEAA